MRNIASKQFINKVAKLWSVLTPNLRQHLLYPLPLPLVLPKLVNLFLQYFIVVLQVSNFNAQLLIFLGETLVFLFVTLTSRSLRRRQLLLQIRDLIDVVPVVVVEALVVFSQPLAILFFLLEFRFS